MKKIFSLTLSLLFFTQSSLFAQTFFPTANDVASVYNKINERAGSLPSLKKIADDTHTTPIIALASITSATDMIIDNKNKFGAFLKEWHIPVEPDASILDISEASFQELRRRRVADGALVSHFDEIYEKAEKLVLDASELEPRIIEQCEDYLKAYQESIIQKELKKMKIQNLGVRLEEVHLKEVTDRFVATCERAGVEVGDFIRAYNNLTQLKTKTSDLVLEEQYFNAVVEDFFAYRGEYIASKEIDAMRGDGKKLFELTERYYKEAYEAELAHSNALDLADYWLKENEANPIMENYQKMMSAQYRADDMGFKYAESRAKKETIDKYFLGKPLIEFTKKGGLFIGILGAIYLAEEYMKNIATKRQVGVRNNNDNMLKDMLADNSNNLFQFIEILPEKAKESAFTYIAENYYDEFSTQATNLIFSLAMLEKVNNQESSLPTETDTEVNQEFEQYFDKNYKIVEEQIGSYGL